MANLFFMSGQSWPDENGVPYPLAKLYSYVTGTTTDQDNYTTAALSVANAHPVVAGSDGVFPDIYLAAKRYKFVLKTAAGVTLKTWDPVDATSQMLTSASAPSPTYPFLRYYNTGDGHVYRRNAADDAWIDEGLVDSLLNAATVAEILAGTSTAKAATPDSVAAIWQRGSDITPSAGAISLPSTGGKHFNLAAGNFSSCSSAVGGREVWLTCAGINVVTHNSTSMECDGGANVTTAAGDILVLINKAATDATGSNYRVHVIRKSGSSITLTDLVATQAQQEAGSATTVAVTPGRQHFHQSAAKCWTQSIVSGAVPASPGAASYNIASITDTATGRATFVIATDFSSANWCCLHSVEEESGAGEAWSAIATGTQAAGSVEINCQSDSGTLSDPGAWHMAGLGDQA